MAMHRGSSNMGNPWNGLRTYSEGEVIYGRSEEIHVLSLLILQNNQTVVYGRSGIGKSSILNAGIFPIVRKHGVFPVYVRFEHNADISYLDQIKDAIRQEVDKSGGKIQIKKFIDKTGEESLWEFFHRIEYHDEEGRVLKPMIVFDQFEEIFTLENNKEKVNHFFRELADLINNVMPENLADSVSPSENTRVDSDSDDGMMDLGLDLFSDVKYCYKTDSDCHLVFTLREDFLSYLERHTGDMPKLKNNRYCLQPINEEQAAEIIMQPRPGLVDVEVAKLIIQKVTGDKDFEIDGIPEIQVDSAILSLYLSRLYDKMLAEGESRITTQLVEAHSDNIIEDFYNDAVYDLPGSAVEWLENTLVNEEGRRDNRDRSTVIRESGLTERQLDRLVYDVKLLRQFSYGGDLRIEFIHDVLCPVVLKHRKDRIEHIQLEALQTQAKKDKRSLLIKTISIAALVLIGVVCLALWLFEKYDTVQILDQQQNLVLSLDEDNTVSDIDFWRAKLTVTGKYNSRPDTVLLSQEIDKTSISSPFTINTDSCSNIQFTLDFGDFCEVGKYINQSVDLPISTIMDSPYVKLLVSRDLPNLVPYKGKILLDVPDNEMPVENAYVIIGDNFTTTDSVGNFEILLEQLPDSKTSVMIAKGSLGCVERPAVLDDKDENIFRILPLDSLQSYYDKIALMIDSVSNWNYSTVGAEYCANVGSQNGIYTKFSDGHEDRLKMYWKIDSKEKDKVLLSGYFFFLNEKNELDKENIGKYAYYFGSGYIDSKTKKDEINGSYRNYEFKGYDAAGNLRKITGKYYVVKGAGKYAGEITTSKKQIASFGLKVDD